MSEGKIEEAAVRFVLLLEESKQLRHERADFRCLRERRWDEACAKAVSEGADLTMNQPTPCWKDARRVAPDDYEPLPRDEWCATCLARQAIHDRYMETVRSRGAWLRILTRRVAARKAQR